MESLSHFSFQGSLGVVGVWGWQWGERWRREQRQVGPTSDIKSILPTCPHLPGSQTGLGFLPLCPWERGQYLPEKGRGKVMLGKALGACRESKYNLSKGCSSPRCHLEPPRMLLLPCFLIGRSVCSIAVCVPGVSDLKGDKISCPGPKVLKQCGVQGTGLVSIHLVRSQDTGY